MRARFRIPDGIVWLTEPSRLVILLVAALLIAYCVIPLWLGLGYQSPYMIKLAGMAGVAAVFVVIGFHVSVIDAQFGARRWAIAVDGRTFHIVVWSAFLVYCIVVFATAESIPFLTALRGGVDQAGLNQERADFLKLREGWQGSLRYFGATFAGALLPYSVATLLRRRTLGGYGALGAYILYAESFLQKALFLEVLLPIFYLIARRKLWNLLGFVALLLLAALLLYGNARLVQNSAMPGMPDISLPHLGQIPGIPTPSNGPSGSSGNGPAGTQDATQQDTNQQLALGTPFSFGDWFDARYMPRSSLGMLVWRAVAVPVFTARDALVVFDKFYGGRQLLGATSSVFAKVLGLHRVNYDAAVYKYEWGGLGYGRSNAAYFLEGFVDFGWLGVIAMSLLVGQCFRIFQKTNDEALRAMSPLFAYYVLQASFIATMLSAGYLLIFVLALFVDIRWAEKSPRPHLAAAPGE